MPCRGQWSARPLSLVLIVSSPFRTVVDSLFVNNESTVFTDSFDRVGSDPAIALRTWVRAGVCLDILVEACFVDISGCHCSHRVSGNPPVRRAPHPLRGRKTLCRTAAPTEGFDEMELRCRSPRKRNEGHYECRDRSPM